MTENSSAASRAKASPPHLSDPLLLIANEAASRAAKLFAGLNAYYQHPYRRKAEDKPVLWQEGTARLLDYGTGGEGPVVLCIPSLINRAYILDLKPGRSLMAFLGTQGFYPMLCDWDQPGAEEKSFGLEEYLRRIEAMAEVAIATRRKVVLLGYCMGGTMVLPIAERLGNRLAGLALLAAPWDFHVPEVERIELNDEAQATLVQLIHGWGGLPKYMVQALFYCLRPWQVIEKFMRFASVDPHSEEAEEFIAIEHWANDGVAMSAKVAEECLIGWTSHNILARGRWQYGNAPVDPSRITAPTLVVIPKRDQIVPPASTEPLIHKLHHAERLEVESGHIAMVVGKRAQSHMWIPLANWISRI